MKRRSVGALNNNGSPKKLKVDELRRELSRLGQPTHGIKAELVERLNKAHSFAARGGDDGTSSLSFSGDEAIEPKSSPAPSKRDRSLTPTPYREPNDLAAEAPLSPAKNAATSEVGICLACDIHRIDPGAGTFTASGRVYLEWPEPGRPDRDHLSWEEVAAACPLAAAPRAEYLFTSSHPVRASLPPPLESGAAAVRAAADVPAAAAAAAGVVGGGSGAFPASPPDFDFRRQRGMVRGWVGYGPLVFLGTFDLGRYPFDRHELTLTLRAADVANGHSFYPCSFSSASPLTTTPATRGPWKFHTLRPSWCGLRGDEALLAAWRVAGCRLGLASPSQGTDSRSSRSRGGPVGRPTKAAALSSRLEEENDAEAAAAAEEEGVSGCGHASLPVLRVQIERRPGPCLGTVVIPCGAVGAVALCALALPLDPLAPRLAVLLPATAAIALAKLALAPAPAAGGGGGGCPSAVSSSWLDGYLSAVLGAVCGAAVMSTGACLLAQWALASPQVWIEPEEVERLDAAAAAYLATAFAVGHLALAILAKGLGGGHRGRGFFESWERVAQRPLHAERRRAASYRYSSSGGELMGL